MIPNHTLFDGKVYSNAAALSNRLSDQRWLGGYRRRTCWRWQMDGDLAFGMLTIEIIEEIWTSEGCKVWTAWSPFASKMPFWNHKTVLSKDIKRWCSVMGSWHQGETSRWVSWLNHHVSQEQQDWVELLQFFWKTTGLGNLGIPL